MSDDRLGPDAMRARLNAALDYYFKVQSDRNEEPAALAPPSEPECQACVEAIMHASASQYVVDDERHRREKTIVLADFAYAMLVTERLIGDGKVRDAARITSSYPEMSALTLTRLMQNDLWAPPLSYEYLATLIAVGVFEPPTTPAATNASQITPFALLLEQMEVNNGYVI